MLLGPHMVAAAQASSWRRAAMRGLATCDNFVTLLESSKRCWCESLSCSSAKARGTEQPSCLRAGISWRGGGSMYRGGSMLRLPLRGVGRGRGCGSAVFSAWPAMQRQSLFLSAVAAPATLQRGLAAEAGGGGGGARGRGRGGVRVNQRLEKPAYEPKDAARGNDRAGKPRDAAAKPAGGGGGERRAGGRGGGRGGRGR